MGNLARYLQEEFSQCGISGWKSHPEVRVLSSELESHLGYKPRADVLLEREDGSKRLWIEFEVSRADPVANHAKFATAHLFEPQMPSDIFISMVSTHVDSGRRNLAANTILLMRRIGMNAFQTILLPQHSPIQVKYLNSLRLSELKNEHIQTQLEINRAISISESITSTQNKRIYFASHTSDVLANLRCWNLEMNTPSGKQTWGKRTVTYFVFDSETQQFAPSKFCAYTPVEQNNAFLTGNIIKTVRPVMIVELYSQLDGTDHRFDGRRARLHLTQGLAMVSESQNQNPSLRKLFDAWFQNYTDSITVHPSGAVFISPLSWSAGNGKN